MTEMSSEGKSIWLLLGGIVFVLVLALLFMMFSGAHLRHRWGQGHFSSRRTDAVCQGLISLDTDSESFFMRLTHTVWRIPQAAC